MHRTDNLVLSSNSSLFIQYVEDALTMLEVRITLHGTGYTHYWYIFAACALLRSTLSLARVNGVETASDC